MSSNAQSGAGRREVAYRLFATEYEDADFEYSENEADERAPNYVVTPTGARVNRLFVVGVLTEVDRVNEDMLRGRVVDPTGAFVVYAGQYQPDQLTVLERLEPPAFVAVTGKARTFQPEDSDVTYTSIRPESITDVDASNRDRWTVQTAQHTIDRIATIAAALQRPERGDDLRAQLEADGVEDGLAAGIPLAIDHYGTTATYLDRLRDLAVQAAEVVAGRREEVEALDTSPAAAGEVTPADLLASLPEERRTATSPEPSTEAATDRTVDDERTVAAPNAGAEADDAEPSAAEPESTEPAEGASQESAVSDEAADRSTAETDELYDLDEEEREEIEAEFDTDFSTGSEIESPAESAAETDPDAPSAQGSERTAETDDGGDVAKEAEETGEESAPASEAGSVSTDEAGESPAEESAVDLEEAVVEAMRDLDDGDGASRDAVLESVSAASGVPEAAVDEAIDDALMSGKCYEPDEGTLKAI